MGGMMMRASVAITHTEERYARAAAGVRSSAMRDLMAITERPGMICWPRGFPEDDRVPPSRSSTHRR